VETSLRFGKDISVSKCINGAKFDLNPAHEDNKIVGEDLLIDMI
jgi:hypothetical protein